MNGFPRLFLIWIIRRACVAVLATLLVACAQIRDPQTQSGDNTRGEAQDTSRIGLNQLYQLESYLYAEPLDTLQIQEIDFDCAVLVYPNDEQILQMKREYGEDDFYIIADDNNWYQAKCTRLLDSANVMMVTPEKQFVRFIGNERTWTLNLRRNGALEWNLIFFSRSKKPEIVSTVDLTMDAIRIYFD